MNDDNDRSPSVALLCPNLFISVMVYELEHALQKCFDFYYSISLAYDDIVLL